MANLEDIKRLREELTKDLEALNRVERLLNLKRQREDIVISDIVGMPTYELKRDIELEFEVPKMSLKGLCIAALVQAGEEGVRPKEIVKYCNRKGYQFRSNAGAAASVQTALARLVVDERVKREEGRYYWLSAQKAETASS